MDTSNGNPAPPGLRIDVWLWAARFFKTRALAQKAVAGGHVHANGQRIKASREVRVGDRLEIQRGQERWTVGVTGLARRRGPATEARRLYEETPESRSRRESERERRAIERASAPRYLGRPDKKGRRELRKLKERSE
jgi:ribosome-associated heat shock protein Hsp15